MPRRLPESYAASSWSGDATLQRTRQFCPPSSRVEEAYPADRRAVRLSFALAVALRPLSDGGDGGDSSRGLAAGAAGGGGGGGGVASPPEGWAEQCEWEQALLDAPSTTERMRRLLRRVRERAARFSA